MRPCVMPIPCSKPKTDLAAVLPSARTSGERTTRNCSLNQGRQAASSSRVGVRLAGGRHFTTLVTKHCARASPTSSWMSWKRSRPLRPMKGSPPSSSSRPGASPMTISAGPGGPEPTTTRWRVSQSTQRVHVGSSAKSRLISVNEDTRHACPNTAKYLPRDGARTLGPPLGRDLLVALAAQEDDLVTGRHGVIAAVDHQHVHGDHAGEGITLRVDKDLGTGVE